MLRLQLRFCLVIITTTQFLLLKTSSFLVLETVTVEMLYIKINSDTFPFVHISPFPGYVHLLDYEKWAQRKKDGFTFEYRFLEDRELP